MVPLPEPGADWGGYRIDREIGRGGRGRTFAAFDAATKRTRALKVLTVVPSDDPAGERFQRHPLRASELEHRNIVTAFASSDVDGTAFVLMDLFPGGSVADEIRVSTLRVGRAREILSQVAAAVDEAQAAGLVHTNIKPTNILCGERGHVVVSDFGCTRFIDDALRSEPVADDEIAGLPFHESPEVLTGDPTGSAADVYSMTSVLYEMLTGRPPFPGRSPGGLTSAHRTSPVPRITELRPDLPEEFDAFIARGMAKDPSQRPRNGAEFISELDVVIKATLDHRRAEARRERDEKTADRAGRTADPFEPFPDDAPAEDESADEVDAQDEGPDRVLRVPESATAYRGKRAAQRDGIQWRLEDGTIDGAVLGVYEDDPPRRWVGVILTLVLLIAIGVVAWLAYRAVQADSETGIDAAPHTVTQIEPASSR